MNLNTQWDTIEDKTIHAAYAADAPILEIAEFLHRTPGAVRVRACRIEAKRAKDKPAERDTLTRYGTCINCGKSIAVKWARDFTETERDDLAAHICECRKTATPTEAVGACRFCGQAEMIDCMTDSTQQEKDEAATLTCNCAEARIYAEQIKQIENAKEKIRRLFGDEAAVNGFTPISRNKVIELMDAVVSLISRHELRCVTLEITSRVKAKLSVTSKGKITVERTDTTKSKLEED